MKTPPPSSCIFIYYCLSLTLVTMVLMHCQSGKRGPTSFAAAQHKRRRLRWLQQHGACNARNDQQSNVMNLGSTQAPKKGRRSCCHPHLLDHHPPARAEPQNTLQSLSTSSIKTIIHDEPIPHAIVPKVWAPSDRDSRLDMGLGPRKPSGRSLRWS